MKDYLYIILPILTWILKALIDLGVKHSKTTENTIDNFIFNKLRELFNIIIHLKKKK